MSQASLKREREQRNKRMYQLYMQTPYKLMDTQAAKRQQRREQRREKAQNFKFVSSPSNITLQNTNNSLTRMTYSKNGDNKKEDMKGSVGTHNSFIQTIDSYNNKSPKK